MRMRSPGECDTRMVVDCDVDVLPTNPPVIALPGPVTRDAVADPVESAELFDVDVDQFAGVIALVAADGLDRLQCPQPV